MIFKLHKIPNLRRARDRIPTLFFLTLISLKSPVVVASLNVLWSLSNLGKFPHLLHWRGSKARENEGSRLCPFKNHILLNELWNGREFATDLSAIFPSLLIRREAHFSFVYDNDHLLDCSQQRSSHSPWYFLLISFGCLFLIT